MTQSCPWGRQIVDKKSYLTNGKSSLTCQHICKDMPRESVLHKIFSLKIYFQHVNKSPYKTFYTFSKSYSDLPDPEKWSSEKALKNYSQNFVNPLQSGVAFL